MQTTFINAQEAKEITCNEDTHDFCRGDYAELTRQRARVMVNDLAMGPRHMRCDCLMQ